MKNGSFFYDHSVDREEVSKVLGGNADARNSADAADLNNSALLQDEPSSQQHFTTNKLPNSLDSVNGSRMVFNLFIEGEEPEYVEDDGEEEAKEIAVELTGFTKLENGSYVSNRAVDYTKLSVGRLNKLLTKDTLTKSDVEDLKDHKFMMLFDKQTAIEKGFLIGVGDNGSYTSKNAHWITNIDHKIKKSGGNPQDLVNNPIALSALAVVSKGDETLSIEQAIERAMSQTNGTIETGDSMVWALSKNSLNKMIAKTNKDGEKPYQAERIKAIQNLKALALAAKEPMIRDDESSDAEVESIYEYMTKFSDDDKVFNLRFLCKKYKKPRKNLKDKMHSMAVMDKAPTSQTDNEISADGQLVDLEISFVQEKLEKGDVIGGADSTMGRSDLSPSVGNRDASIANTPKNTTAQDKNRFADIGYIAGSRKEMAQAQADLSTQLAIADKLEAEYGYLPAPNGEKSNLNKQQWAQVRTPQFKAWFGDWDTVNNLEWLDNAEPVARMKGDEVPRFDKVKPLADWVGEHWESSTGGQVDRADLGVISVDRKAASNSAGHGFGAVKTQAFYLVPEALKQGRLLGKLPEVKGKPEAFIIAAPIGIGEKTYRLLMEVRRDANMQRLYVHEAVLRDNVAIDGFVSAADHSDGIKPHSPHKGYIYNFMLGLREKQAQGASKVVDANGEPLVVYHGTSADFDTFSVRESSTNSGNDGYYGKGFYFSVYDGEASTYGVAVVPAYLNIKNPIEDFSKDIENIAINNYGYEKTKQSINHGFIVQKIKEADANAGLLAELFIKTGVNDKRKMWDDFKSFGGSMQSKLNLNEVIDMLEEPLSYEREIISQFGEIPDSEYIYGFNAEPDIRHLTDNGNHAKTFSDIAKNGGFDGVFANSEIIAFYPNQIKSAIGNVGTFSKESNKIMDAAQMLNTLDLIEPDLIDEGFEV